MNIVIIGPSGSGKGTQAKLLSKEFGIPSISTGDLFRRAYKEKTPIGLKAARVWLKGEWVPTDLTFKLLGPELDKAKGFIIDGFPRLPNQPAVLEKYLKETNRKIDKAIHLKISDEESIKRLLLRAEKDREKEGKARSDETIKVIKRRLQSYHENTRPILKYYQERNILMEIDGERPIEVIFKDIMSRLKNSDPGSV